MPEPIGDTLLSLVPKSELTQVIDEFIVSRRAGNCSKRTVEYYQDELGYPAPGRQFIGGMSLDL